MNNTIVLSSDVLNTIKSLPLDQQFTIVSAIAGEMIFGAAPHKELNSEDMRIYSVIRRDINRDSQSYTYRMSV